jgi:penicillin amidase
VRKGDWKLVRGAATLAALCALLAPAGAAAKVLRAESVLPPGQSGFVSATGVLEGTGSPHLLDQTELFENFEYKNFMFGQPGQTESLRDGVTITRDAYGVPAIRAGSDYDAWWGVGYAVAQDRLFQLEAFRRATSGHLAEINGVGSLRADVIARRDYYSNGELQKQLDALPDRLMARFKGYRDGINAWAGQVMTNPLLLPGEFAALLTTPPHWTLLDSARVGVFLARTVPSGDGAELANAAALDQLGPKSFGELLPLRSPGRLPTIPKEEGGFPSNPGATPAQERKALDRSVDFVHRLDLPESPSSGEGTLPAPVTPPLATALTDPFGRRGSFMWAIGGQKGKPTYLYNGPQLGFSLPELFVEFELHSRRQDVRGVSAAGVPVVGIGHNEHVAWGFTSGLTDDDDLYAEKLTGPETYMYKGRERQMDCHDEDFSARERITSLLDLIDDPASVQLPLHSETVRICRTVHGPVQTRYGGYAYARRYAIWGKEIKTVVGLTDLNDADSIRDVNRAMEKVTWNENVMAADDRGNIGYWHPGLLPLRPRGYDDRLPYPGTGEAEWRGFLRKEDRPHVINPKQGWLANWNNVPSQDWDNGDTEARERLTGRLHRVVILRHLVAKAARHPSFRRSTNIAKTSGTTAQQFPFSQKIIRKTHAKADGLAKRAMGQLLDWDGNYARVRSDGTIDAGAAIWEAFKEEAGQIALARIGPGAQLLDGGAGGSHRYDIRNAESWALRNLSPRLLAGAAERASTHLRERFGSSDPSSWRDPRLTLSLEAMGAGQAPRLPFFDRGTWNQSLELGR